MKYLSICSGIEAATVAFHPLGWTPVAFAEIEAFPSAVLAHHYPDVPNFGDMTKFREWPEELLAECDMLVGGPPCQAFSVAGNRNSLDDERGNLTLTYVHLIDYIDAIRKKHGRNPIIALYENVPGIYSTKDNAFGCLVGAICGQDAAVETETGKWPTTGVFWGQKRRVGYRTLDAQYFGVAQRRRRVFLVAVPNQLVQRIGNGADPAEILSIPESLRGDSAPSRETWEEVTPTIRSGAPNGSPIHGQRSGDTRDELIVPVKTFDFQSSGEYGTGNVASTMSARDYKSAKDLAVTHSLRGGGQVAIAFSGQMSAPQVDFDMTSTLGAKNPMAVAVEFAQNSRDEVRLMGGDGSIVGALAAEPGMKQTCYVAQSVALRGREGGATAELGDEVSNCLRASGGGGDKAHVLAPSIGWSEELTPSIELAGTLQYGGQGGRHDGVMMPTMQVRRLTPVECERLQGFPDGYTNIPWRKQPTSPDGPRYKALGNSMCTNVMLWIGLQIKKATSQ